jgi:hypothetical protein
MPDLMIKKLDRKARRLGISRAELMRVTLALYADEIELVTQVRTTQVPQRPSWWASLWSGCKPQCVMLGKIVARFKQWAALKDASATVHHRLCSRRVSIILGLQPEWRPA